MKKIFKKFGKILLIEFVAAIILGIFNKYIFKLFEKFLECNAGDLVSVTCDALYFAYLYFFIISIFTVTLIVMSIVLINHHIKKLHQKVYDK